MERIKKIMAILSLIIVSLSFLLLTVQFFHHMEKGAFRTIRVNGVLDRFENNQAVILIEELKEEIAVPVETLPKGSREYMWFDIHLKKKGFEIISINQEKTEKQTKRVEQLLKNLRE